MSSEEFKKDSAEEGSASSSGRFRSRMKDFEGQLRQAAKDFDDLVRDGMKNMVPEEVSTHITNSKREFLLAIRALVDREIERTEKKPPEEKP